MTESDPPSQESAARVAGLRIWPLVVLLLVMWVSRVGVILYGEASIAAMMIRFMVPLVCAALIVLWWLFFSRALIRGETDWVDIVGSGCFPDHDAFARDGEGFRYDPLCGPLRDHCVCSRADHNAEPSANHAYIGGAACRLAWLWLLVARANGRDSG